MGRYTLVNNGKDVPYYTKAYLEEIDRFTIREDEYGLEENFKMMGLSGKVRNLHIYYRANNEDKVLETLDEEYSYLSKIEVKEGKIDITDSTFQNKVMEIINKLISNKNLFTAVQKSCSVSEKVKEYLERYIETRSSFDYNKLLEHLSQYIQFRKLIVFVNQFLELGYAPEEKKIEDYKEEDLSDMLDFVSPIPPKR